MTTTTRGLLSAAVLLPGLASAAPEDQATTGSTYALEPGTVLEYRTSASLSAEMIPGGGERQSFKVRYTVMSAGAEGRTIFAAVEPEKDAASTASKSGEDIGGRFTFQLQPDGSLGERMAGVAIPPFMGWTPMIDFPPVPQDQQTTISWPIPAFGLELPVTASRTSEGGNVVVRLSFDPKSLSGPGEDQQGPLGGFTGQYVYVPAENAAKSSQYALEARSRGPQGTPVSVRLAFDSSRTSLSKLPPAEVENLRKDVSAGVPVFEEVRQAMSQEDQQTSKAVEAIDRYLSQYPQGQFAQIYSEQKKLIQRMSETAARAAQIKEGVKAPEFSAKTLDGETLKLADLRGRVVLLDFWASWCGPCVREMPNVKKTYDQYKDKGFTVVGISADHTEKALRDFLAENKYDWKMIYQEPDAEGTILEQYGIQKFPTTLLLDREGTIRAVDLRGEELHRTVGELVAEKK